MRLSQLFTKTLREPPKDEKSINAQLLIRGGFIRKLMAGVYTFLPLGWQVHKKIEEIIREEMNKIGGQEIFMPTLNPRKAWEITNRWKYPEMFKLKSRQNKDYSLGWTHEEIVVPLAKEFLRTHRDLPFYVYQIQNKFRDELRVKSGLLRGVEFMMKDLYSFHRDEKDLDNYYDKVKKAYFKIFKRCGLEKITYLCLASGGTFSQYSHEFQTITPFGEDEIYLCQKCKLAINREIIKREKNKCSQCGNKNLVVKKSIEVGNIFKLMDRFSRPFDLAFINKEGRKKTVLMGCYGIGLGRLMGAIVETSNDEKGIIWPAEVSPYQIHLIQIENNIKIKKFSEKLYQDLQKANIKVLYDDRNNKTAGEKFADADLIGIPYRLVVSERTLIKNCIEIKKRNENRIKLAKIKSIIQQVNS